MYVLLKLVNTKITRKCAATRFCNNRLSVGSACDIAELKRREQGDGLVSEGEFVALRGLVFGVLHVSRLLSIRNDCWRL